MAAAGAVPAAVAGAAPRQMSGSDKTLADALADVPAPSLMCFNDWQKWRKTSGTRPGVARGDPAMSTSTQEIAVEEHDGGAV